MLNAVEDVVGSQVAWPEDLIVFIDDIVVNNLTFELVLFHIIPNIYM